LALTFGFPWAVLAVVGSRGAGWSWALLAAALALRIAVALVVGWSVLRDRQVLRLMPWLPLRDLVAALVWLASLTGHHVVWRGDSFTLKDGKLARIDS
jgi:ceramide glucosyltransferase